MAPGATALFGSNGGSTTLAVDANFDPTNVFVSKGHARVMASGTKGIVCSAFLADASSPSPTSMVGLTIAKKTKQKGD